MRKHIVLKFNEVMIGKFKILSCWMYSMENIIGVSPHFIKWVGRVFDFSAKLQKGGELEFSHKKEEIDKIGEVL